jgi:ABC-2 type transport system ATP-binding protein
MHAIELDSLVKTYGATRALDGLDLTMARGTILGVLGPNGAGKTTTVKVLTTLINADSGRALVDGIDVSLDPAAVRARIGLTGQFAAVEERLTGRENIEHIARLFHMSRADARARARELLERFDLVDAADRMVNGYSGGMRRRLDIAMSLISRPAVLFLDEPTTGLDPRSRLAMWGLIQELHEDGTTTFLTTQYLDEAETLADTIAVIDHGRVIAEGTADALKNRIGGDRLIVTIAHAENVGRAAEALAALATGTIEVDRDAASLTIPIAAGSGAVPRSIRMLDDATCEVIDVEVRRPSLDDVFLTLTGASPDDMGGGPTTAAGDRP